MSGGNYTKEKQRQREIKRKSQLVCREFPRLDDGNDERRENYHISQFSTYQTVVALVEVTKLLQLFDFVGVGNFEKLLENFSSLGELVKIVKGRCGYGVLGRRCHLESMRDFRQYVVLLLKL